MNELETAVAPKQNRMLMAALGGAVLLFTLLLVGFFAWRALGTASVASASAIPADATVFASVDFVNLLDPVQAGRFFKAVEPALASEGLKTSLDETIAEWDTMLSEEAGVTFTEDIRPWIGRSMGLAVLDITFDESGEVANGMILVTIESRDQALAQAFVDKMVASESELTFAKAEYEGTSYQTATKDERTVSVVVTKDLVILSFGNKDGLPLALDAQAGESLVDSAVYQAVVSKLPADRTASLFVNGAIMKTIMDASMAANPMFDPAILEGEQFAFDAVNGFAMSVGMAEAGLQMDSVAVYDETKFTETQKEFLAINNISGESIGLLPDSTMAYVAMAGLEPMWSSVREGMLLSISEEELNESMGMAKDFLGVNPDTELMPVLGDEMVFAVVKTEAGLFMEMMEMPIGLIFGHRLQDAAKMQEMAGTIQTSLEAQGMVVVPTTVGEASLYEVQGGDTSFMTYGVNNEYVVMASDATLAEAMFATTNRLRDTVAFQNAEQVFGRGSRMIMYVDLVELAKLEADNTELNALAQNMPTFAAASQFDENNVMQTKLILFMD